jgi:hypothetical protein
MRIGIDIGGVIIGGQGEDTFFSADFLDTPPISGAFDAIRSLVNEHGAENVYIISKCGPTVQTKSIIWLFEHDFFFLTGMRPENVFFVRKRPEKAPLAETLELDAFIDDRADVLAHMSLQKVLFSDWDSALAELR